MPVKVLIPTALEQYVGRRDTVEVLGSTVRKQPAAAKETVDEDVPQVETQTY